MQKRIIVSLLLLILNIFCFSQTTVPDSIPYDKAFVKLKNGEFYIGSSLIMERNFFSTKIILDGQTFKSGKVDFYNDDILYGHFKRQYFLPLVLRTNKINFFEGIYETNGSNGKRSIAITYFYSREINKVKRLRTRNLVHDLTDDPIAYKQIKSANKAGLISLVSIVGSYALAMAPLFLGKEPQGVYYAIPIGGVITGIVYQFIRKRRTQHALIQYAPTLPNYQPKFFTRKQRRHAKTPL